ncbi:MAG: DUF2892 domain-containing protein [Kiritimatiellae bacterium]|nr:DUF2892 domain-containing protein [Kiritimatiellia bacterium]
MTVDNGVRVVAGTMTLVSLALGLKVSPWWFLLTAFVGVNLIQSAFTGFCPAANILKKLGLKSGAGT